jgi:hypothetical protein
MYGQMSCSSLRLARRIDLAAALIRQNGVRLQRGAFALGGQRMNGQDGHQPHHSGLLSVSACTHCQFQEPTPHFRPVVHGLAGKWEFPVTRGWNCWDGSTTSTKATFSGLSFLNPQSMRLQTEFSVSLEEQAAWPHCPFMELIRKD